MPSAGRDIQRRIRSVSSTKKITKAMELVASAKMRRASQAVVATRPYTDHAWDMLLNLTRQTDPSQHPLLEVRAEVKKVGIVLVASNRGLVGGFNAQLLSATATYARELGTDVQAEVILMGNRGKAIFTQHHIPLAAEFTKDDIVTSTLSVRPMARMAVARFLDGTYDRVVVAYMDFVSTLVQAPRLRQILPLSGAGFIGGGASTSPDTQQPATEYVFEPNPDAVLEYILPRLVEMQMYRAVLETNAAEQAARMVAMKSASDAAGDLIDELTLSYNQARQAAITQDLSEISAGRAALES